MPNLLRPYRVLVAALLLGAAADYLFNGRALGVSAPLFVALGLALLARLGADERRPATRANLWLGGAALFFALCLAWRASATLTALNAAAVAGLLALLALSYRAAPLHARHPAELLAGLAGGLGDMLFQPGALAAGALRAAPAPRLRLASAGRVGCGLLLALPVLFIFTGLLMAADAVFASYVEQLLSFDIPFDLADLLGHALFAGAAAWACAGGLLVALVADERWVVGRALAALARALVGLVYVEPAEAAGVEDLPAEGDTQRLRAARRAPIAIGATEALTVLALVDLLFGGFVAIQGAYFFGGLDTLARTGMTYAEYARRGFFELLAVACLSLGLLCALAVVTRRPAARVRRAFNAASAAMIALVLGLLASAFERMALYEQAYGYTELRVYTHTFMIWLALVLGLFLLALFRARPQIFTFGGLVSLVVYLAALNLANPDALIVRENIARVGRAAAYSHRGEEVDVFYLTQLSPDATPALAASLGQLNGESWLVVAAALGGRHDELARQQAADGWPSWHLGRASALWAIERTGLARPQ